MKTKIIFASIFLISLLLMQFSSAATFSHETAFTIEDDMGQKVLKYYPYVLSLEGQKYWANLCLYCDSEEMQAICKCGDQTNLKLAERSLLFNGNKEATQAIIDSLEQQFDSGAQPLGVSAFISEIYNPLVQADAIRYLSSEEFIRITNNGEISGGILRISDSSKNLKEIIYPNDKTERSVFVSNAIINFDSKSIILNENGQYDYEITKNPCGSTVSNADTITIKKTGDGKLEIPFSPGSLSSCSSVAIALNEYKNYENNIFKNWIKSSLYLLDQMFSKTSKVCVNSDTTFQEYYYVCNIDYTPITISPTKDSSFVLHFNEEDGSGSLANVFCGSNAYTVYANYKDPKSYIAKPNIRLNNPRCFRLTDGAVMDLAMNEDKETEFQEKIYVSNDGNLKFNLNPSLGWGENNEIAYGDDKISSQNGLTTYNRFSIIDSLSEDSIDYIKTV